MILGFIFSIYTFISLVISSNPITANTIQYPMLTMHKFISIAQTSLLNAKFEYIQEKFQS